MPDQAELERLCRVVASQNPKQVQQYRAGKTALGFLVGRFLMSVRYQTHAGVYTPQEISATFIKILKEP